MIAFSTNTEKGYVIISIKGKPTLADYVEAAATLDGHKLINSTTHRIVDITSGELSVSNEELATFIDRARKLPLEKTTCTALIGKTESERTTLNWFASSFDRGQFKVFETGRDALAWILFSPREKPAIAKDKIRIHRLLGDITTSDVLSLQNSWFNAEGFDKDAPILWDLRQARLRVEVEELQTFAEQMQEYSRKHRPDGRAAALVGSNLHEAILGAGFEKGVALGRLKFFREEKLAVQFLTS